MKPQLRVYLDNCCFNRPYDDQTSIIVKTETDLKLEIQRSIITGNFDLVWSYILDYENYKNPFEDRKRKISKWRNIAKINILESDSIIERLDALLKIGFKTMDALHLSCAVEAKCDYFITVDKGIITKRSSLRGIKICNPLEFIEEVSNE